MATDSASAIIQAALDSFGLGSLGSWAWQRYLETGDTNQVMLDLRSRPEYQARFPAMAELAKRGQAISEAAYIDYERTVSQLLQQYGVPQEMYATPQGIARLLTNDVSASEVNSRLKMASAAAMTAPQEVRDALRDQYGVTPGGMVAYYLDPEKAQPLLEQQFAAAQVTGAARRNQVEIDVATSERLAAEGVSYGQAEQGFGQVAQQRSLTTGLEGGVSQQDLVSATFGDAEAQRRVDAERASRVNRFQQGGGAAESQQGVIGLARR